MKSAKHRGAKVLNLRQFNVPFYKDFGFFKDLSNHCIIDFIVFKENTQLALPIIFCEKIIKHIEISKTRIFEIYKLGTGLIFHHTIADFFLNFWKVRNWFENDICTPDFDGELMNLFTVRNMNRNLPWGSSP